jgi:hypothetical protein
MITSAKLGLRFAIFKKPKLAFFNVAKVVALRLFGSVQTAGVGADGAPAKIVIAHAGMNARIAVLRTAQD